MELKHVYKAIRGIQKAVEETSLDQQLMTALKKK